jgi:ligand-binding SRPBCC domain-containing protein
MTYHFESEIKINAPLEDVFNFFSQAENLEKITPPWLKFKILTPTPINMGVGTLIDYRLSLYKIPLKWQTKISHWEPPHRFIDEQLRGPYKLWIHEHSFSEVADGCLIRDKVQYQLKGGMISPLLNQLFVRADIERIFSYRKKKIAELYR